MEPRIQIDRGDDDYAIAQHLQTMIAEFLAQDMGELNLTRLSGNTASLEEMTQALTSAPFFTDHRLVILTEALPPIKKRPGETEDLPATEEAAAVSADTRKQRFLGMLEQVPETTRLVLVIPDSRSWNSKKRVSEWEILHETHYLTLWVRNHPGLAAVRDFELPKVDAMPAWITRAGADRGLTFQAAAAIELAQYVGNDTRLAGVELQKLEAFRGDQQEVRVEDVAAICTFTSSATIWQLVDAISLRNVQRALGIYHQLLETMDPEEIFPLIIRQFRLLLMTREVLIQGGGEGEIAAALGIAPFQVKNLVAPARKYQPDELKSIYRQLLRIEEAGRSSEASLEVLIDAFIAGMAAGGSNPIPLKGP